MLSSTLSKGWTKRDWSFYIELYFLLCFKKEGKRKKRMKAIQEGDDGPFTPKVWRILLDYIKSLLLKWSACNNLALVLKTGGKQYRWPTSSRENFEILFVPLQHSRWNWKHSRLRVYSLAALLVIRLLIHHRVIPVDKLPSSRTCTLNFQPSHLLHH